MLGCSITAKAATTGFTAVPTATTLYGEDFYIKDNARAGNDRLEGGSGNDTLFGDGAAVSGNARVRQ